MKKDRTLKLYYGVLVLIALLIGAIVYVSSSGLSINATLEENRYLWYSSKRDKIVFSLYRDANHLHLDAETVHELSVLYVRQQEISRLQDKTDELQEDIRELLVLDNNMQQLDLGVQLTANADGYVETDQALSDLVDGLEVYLEAAYAVTSYYIEMETVDSCYNGIDFGGDSKRIMLDINSCNSTLVKVNIPSDELTDVYNYHTTLESYWSTNYKLYSALYRNSASDAQGYKSTLQTYSSQLPNLQKASDAQLSKYLYDLYTGTTSSK